MNADKWEKLEYIFHAAIDLPFGERKPFLQRACAGDRRLLAEVESLLENFESKPGFLDEPVFELGLGAMHDTAQKDISGSVIGGYELRKKIGAGGMGEVYQAFDRRLNRIVALKFISQSLKNDPSARRQLMREARAAAALEHPNICPVYGFEETDEHHFIVMQYVEGKTLGDRFRRQTVGAAEFKMLARQILEAVAFAHAHGVIHRDLKPGNIMVTADRQIKILDFGLAKIEPTKELPGENAGEQSRFSQNGLIIGTVSNMSPEQLRGEKLDYRSDIFSVGIIFYELLTGKNPFYRESQAETIVAILSQEPAPLRDSAPETPEGLRRLVEKCLCKQPDARFQSAAEILLELNSAEANYALQFSGSRRRGFFLKTVLAAVLLIGIFFYFNFLNGARAQRTLAILPISTENLPVEKEYIADGLTGSLIEKLSHLTDFKVKSEYLINRYRGKSVEPVAVGKELQADAVFSGIIKNRDAGPVLVIKLIRTSDGMLLDQFEKAVDENNLLNLPEEISLRIAGKINSRLTDEDKNKITRNDTQSPDAKRAYERGRFYLKTRKNGEDLQKAIQYLNEAKDFDGKYARAWAGLAEGYLLQSLPGSKSAISPGRAVELAKAAAFKALGLINSKYDWDWREAEKNFRIAIERDPEFLPARFGLINILSVQRRFDESLEEARKIKDFDPLSISSDMEIAKIYYRQKEFERADQTITDLLSRAPENRALQYVRCYLLLSTKRYKEAVEILEKMYQSNNDEDRVYAAAPLGFAYGKTGRRAEALKIIKNLEISEKNSYVPAQEKALIYAGLGENDRVFEYLDKSCLEKFPTLPGWLTDPVVDDVKSDERFARIKKCVNLTD